MVRSAPVDGTPPIALARRGAGSDGAVEDGGLTPSVRILERALQLLGCFTLDQPTWRITALARALGCQKAVAHRLVVTLERAGWLERDPVDPNLYRIGARAFEAGALYATTFSLTDRAVAVMRKLTEQTGLTSRLSVLRQGEAVVLASVESTRVLHVRGGVGARYPLHASAAGKALAAFAGDDALVDDAPTLAGYTPETTRSAARFREELRRVREQGYATNHEEFSAGISAIAAPVLGPEGRLVAALSYAYPTAQVAEVDLPGTVDALLEAARYLSAAASATLRIQDEPLS